MKKILVLIFAGIIAMSLVGCGGNTSEQTQKPLETSQTETNAPTNTQTTQTEQTDTDTQNQ